LAVEVDAQDAGVAEEGVDALAVGRRRARGVAVLEADLFRRRVRGDRLPEELAVGAVQAEDRAFLAAVGRGGEEEAFAPDNGRRVTLARQAYFPEDVFRPRPPIRVAGVDREPLPG